MKRVSDHLRDHLLADVVHSEVGNMTESLESLQETEWSLEFETLMRNRLIMGRFRYGRFDRSDNLHYDRVKSIRQRLSAYEQTGNLEHLVDCANLCLAEFCHSQHPDRHFEAHDDGIHAELKPDQ